MLVTITIMDLWLVGLTLLDKLDLHLVIQTINLKYSSITTITTMVSVFRTVILTVILIITMECKLWFTSSSNSLLTIRLVIILIQQLMARILSLDLLLLVPSSRVICLLIMSEQKSNLFSQMLFNINQSVLKAFLKLIRQN